MFSGKQKQQQVQVLKENYYQIAKNNFEAICLSFNRVLFLLGYTDFLKKQGLEIIGQNLISQPENIQIEFDVLLFQMLNLKQIPGLSEDKQLQVVEDNLYNIYIPLNQTFVTDIFKLSLLAIQGRKQEAMSYFQQLKNIYPNNFGQACQKNQKRHEIKIDPTITYIDQPLKDEQVLDGVYEFGKLQHQSNQLIEDLKSGKLKDEDYNKNLYKLGLFEKQKK
ncbi:hypothetical protein ABPG74_005673 [Tetrahymena malaccensis]